MFLDEGNHDHGKVMMLAMMMIMMTLMLAYEMDADSFLYLLTGAKLLK